MTETTVRRAQPWLGTLVSIECAACDGLDVNQAFRNAFAAIERVHRAMSRHEAASDVARFNAAAQGASVDCDAWTVDVLRRAERLRRASAGVFDVALGTAVGSAYRCIGVVDTLAEGAVRSVVPGTVRRVRIEKLAGSARLDLGGIAKGYAVDRAVLALRAAGVRRGRVNAGGDLRAFGDWPWSVVVRDAGAQDLMRFSITRGAVATSVYRAGRSPFHRDTLVAPRDRAIHAIDAAVTVAAPTCVLADALTKVVALSGDARHPLVLQAGGCAWQH